MCSPGGGAVCMWCEPPLGREGDAVCLRLRNPLLAGSISVLVRVKWALQRFKGDVCGAQSLSLITAG